MKALLFLMRRLRVLPMAGRTLPSLSSPSPWLSSLILLSMGGTLLVDIVTPLGIPLWVPYLVPLLLSFWLPFWYAPLLVALGCSSLTLLGWALSPPGADSAWGLLNRVFGIAGLGMTALLLQHVKQITEQREHALQARLAAKDV